METPDLFSDAINALALTAATVESPHPASEALSVPGEPRIVAGILLNCMRVPFGEEYPDLLPDMAEALLLDETLIDWDDVSIESDCHFINVHDAAGKWRIDLSYHYVVAKDEEGEERTIGVAGVNVMETTRIADYEPALTGVSQIVRLLLAAGENGDDRWASPPSIMMH